jgi:NTE family protein
MNPLRLKRVADIAFDQARALRVRSFINFISANPKAGMYFQIGSEPLSCIKRYAKPENIDNISEAHTWFSKKEVDLAASYKTTLRIMGDRDFDLIAEHAYQTSLWNELVFFRNGIP